MTDIVIRQLDTGNQADLNRCDSSYTVDAELCLHAEDARISYTVHPVSPSVKRYDPEVYDPQVYILAPGLPCSAGAGTPDHVAWLAYVDGEFAGRILVHRNWNRFALIWDIAVDPPFRRRGVGRRLIEQAIQWAREQGLPGVMLEAQNVNVAACRLYERCGFVLAGFDRYLYRGIVPDTREIAVFWYLLF